MRLLWLLPKAAPMLLRHLAGYLALAALDWERMQREFTARLIAAAVFGASVFLVCAFGGLALVAATWDTPYRVRTIGALAVLFGFIAVLASVYRARAAANREPPFDSVRREWQQDREILEKLLSDHE